MTTTLIRGAEWRIPITLVADGEAFDPIGSEIIANLCTGGVSKKELRVGSGMEQLDASTFIAVVSEDDGAQTALKTGERNLLVMMVIDSVGVTFKASDPVVLDIAERMPVNGEQ